MSFKFKAFEIILVSALVAGVKPVIYAQTKAIVPQLGKSPLTTVINAMTLEEKATLVVGYGRAPGPRPAAGSLSNGTMIGQTEVKVPGAAGNTAAIPRLGIPSLVMSDGPAGVRISPIRNGDSSKTYYATAFPVGTLLASTWDPLIVKKVGVAFGNEVKEYGIDILLAPGVNIHRNPLNGRNFEYYSEDPLIAGKMAGALINGVQSNGVGTSIKHFAANNQETSRNSVNTIVSERALRELYLKNFEIAIKESNPWTVMSSYNKINGVYTAERHDLLTTILRDEWKFKGFVMTDWGGGSDWIAEMNAGNDLIMPGRPSQVQAIISAVKHDSIKMKTLDLNVSRILNIVLKSPAFKKYPYSDKPDLLAHAEVSRKAATEGIILLKNKNNTLPFNNNLKTIAAFGNATYNTIAGGTGSGDVNKAYVTSIYKGLANANYQPDAGLEAAYTNFFNDTRARLRIAAPSAQGPGGGFGRRQPSIPEMVVSDEIIAQKAENCSIAIITIGRNAGEGSDRNLETNYKLIPEEKQQIKKISESFHQKGKKVVVVLNIGGVIDMNGWQDDADAIVLAWQPGEEAGNAIADILSGKVNPSGRLATTFPKEYSDVPSAKTFPGTPIERPSQTVYEEGVYVGYRYYDSFNITPMYEFGYGLSYTTFSLSGLKLSSAQLDGSLTGTVTVKNTGQKAGREVVQVYISAPAKSIDKPKQELKAFAKTRLLKPGETEIVKFVIKADELGSFHTDRSEWVTDAGKYVVNVGVSSRNILQKASFNIKKSIVKKEHAALQPQVSINELKGIN